MTCGKLFGCLSSGAEHTIEGFGRHVTVVEQLTSITDQVILLLLSLCVSYTAVFREEGQRRIDGAVYFKSPDPLRTFQKCEGAVLIASIPACNCLPLLSLKLRGYSSSIYE